MLRSNRQWIIAILIGLDLESGHDRTYLFLARFATAVTIAAVYFFLASWMSQKLRDTWIVPRRLARYLEGLQDVDTSPDVDHCSHDDAKAEGDSKVDKSFNDDYYCSRDDAVPDGESEVDVLADNLLEDLIANIDRNLQKSADINCPDPIADRDPDFEINCPDPIADGNSDLRETADIIVSSSPDDPAAEDDSHTESQSKLSGDDVTPTKDKSELSSSSTPDHHSKPAPSTSTPVPPHEERSAPEGTSSPTPRPSDTSEHKPSSSRPNSIPPEGYMSTAEELQFEEKLLRAELVSGEKEKKLRQAMKDEQKEMSSLGESVSELTQSRDALLKLVGQYKGMLASLVSEKEKEKQNQEERIKTLEQERNQALEDLANVEVAFSDVHSYNYSSMTES